jgi:K+-transporting ATPase A subunit
MHAEALTVEMAAVAAPVEDIAVDEVAAMLVVVVAAVVVAAVVVAAVVVAEEATARKLIFFFFFFFFFSFEVKKRQPSQQKGYQINENYTPFERRCTVTPSAAFAAVAVGFCTGTVRFFFAAAAFALANNAFTFRLRLIGGLGGGLGGWDEPFCFSDIVEFHYYK